MLRTSGCFMSSNRNVLKPSDLLFLPTNTAGWLRAHFNGQQEDERQKNRRGRREGNLRIEKNLNELFLVRISQGQVRLSQFGGGETYIGKGAQVVGTWGLLHRRIPTSRKGVQIQEGGVQQKMGSGLWRSLIHKSPTPTPSGTMSPLKWSDWLSTEMT